MTSAATPVLDTRHLGRSVKLQLTNGAQVAGRLQSIEADSLVLADGHEPHRIYFESIREVSVRTGSEREGGRMGLLLGAVAGLIGIQTCECDSLAKTFQSTNLWALLVVMLLGALCGRLLGRAWKRWRPVYPVRLPPR